MSFVVPMFFLQHLCFKALTLIDWIIQLCEGIGMLASNDEQFEAIREAWIYIIFLRQW
ncbi:hypothetical protein D3C76_1720650 [compost metagenome]